MSDFHKTLESVLGLNQRYYSRACGCLESRIDKLFLGVKDLTIFFNAVAIKKYFWLS